MTWLHYDKYSQNGIGISSLKFCGLLLRQFATILFVLLLLLIAKGYTITRGKLPALTTVKILVFVTIFLVAHVMMLVWQIAVSFIRVIKNLIFILLAI